MLYDMTDGSLMKVPGTTFKEEKVLERTHLQAGVRDHIEVLGPDLLVVAEEFGDFEDTHRRIDLLCLDKTARLVVVELKRTEDGNHMELPPIARPQDRPARHGHRRK
jgi:RecB family endonuclease NucS